MAHTRPDTMRRALRREVAGTIGLLADEEDFAAMRRYRTFTFDDHESYLKQVEGLLRALAAQGGHTTVALFDPEEYAEYCAATGLEPDAPGSRTRFTAELASEGPTLPYEGQPLTDLVPDLVDEAVRQATWEYATVVLARAGTCATCGEDTGRAAFIRASELIARALASSGPGTRHLVCSVPTDTETLLAALHVDGDTDGETHLDETEALEFTTVLAVGIATRRPAGMVLRTITEGTRDRVHGWRMSGGRLQPLTAAEVFDAYCTDAVSGELVSPESGVDYCAAPDLEDDEPGGGHTH
ncbi:hypothetical protein [Streptomyces formicae]|uniref:Uncharacterized protein n=1 Tax=Streptomyces formicae TaxID=1616117 RepID=A0A291Q344_9ACTN|nr:hypothetical protein [Streptomyces formicae]ATL26139.1 hypothetical protein KY5_1121c [Streptomyces formicae]